MFHKPSRLSPTCAESTTRFKQINVLAEKSKKSAQHFVEDGGSGGGCGGRQLPFGQSHALGQDDAEAVKQGGLGGVWLGDAAQTNVSVRLGRQHHVGD